MTRIEDILVAFGRKLILSVMNLKGAPHQMSLLVGSRPVRCFSKPRGSEQLRVVVMGIKNGVPIFQ